MSTVDVAVHDQFFIDGAWRRAERPHDTIDVIESRNGEVMARVASATPGDIDAAVAAARRAMPAWSATSLDQRVAIMEAVGRAIEDATEELAALEAREIGTVIAENRHHHTGACAAYWRAMASYAQDVLWERAYAGSVAHHVPLGVAGIIAPWNNPLLMTAYKAAPAMTAGCTVVVKISEIAPLSVLRMAELAVGAGLPAGVFNVVSGFGPTSGEALVVHPDVAKVSFTGSVRAARRVAELSGRHLKPVTLELGGKSAALLLPGADLEVAMRNAINSAFMMNGQYCLATTRVLVPHGQLREVEELAATIVEADRTMGDPLDESSAVGPLVSAAQQARAAGLIADAVDQGAQLVTGGADVPDGFERGFYVRPTVLSATTNDMPINQEEVFAPVLTLIGYPDEAEAIAIANDSRYGLGGSVFAADDEHAYRVAQQLHTGSVEINDAPFDYAAPCGGFNESGFGREGGSVGIEDFLTWKTVHRTMGR
jgi:aldehyde dehydrogenase (NAD+)